MKNKWTKFMNVDNNQKRSDPPRETSPSVTRPQYTHQCVFPANKRKVHHTRNPRQKNQNKKKPNNAKKE